MRWQARLEQLTPIADIGALPAYAFQFFFRNMGGFRLPFFLLTAVSVCSSVFRFVVVALLADLISHAATLSVHRVLYWYLPAFAVAIVARELADFLHRRYSEPFPEIYARHAMLRFYRTWFELRSYRLLNASKERLQTSLGKYVGHVTQFLRDWFAITSVRLTQVVIVFGILLYQGPAILAFNLLYIAAFLALSFANARRFSAIARAHSEVHLNTQSVSSRTFLQLNTVKRLRQSGFFVKLLAGLTAETWDKLDDVYAFHAKRWLVQFLLFNALYIGTLIVCVIQVIHGELPLGYLVLVKYAFDNLWDILVYTIEYYVSLVTQKEDAQIIRNDIDQILGATPKFRESCNLGDWREIHLRDAETSFTRDTDGTEIRIRIPDLLIRRGEKIGIIGESGAGKSTVLNMLLGLVPFSGELEVDGRSIKNKEPAPEEVAIVTSSDPFFNISLEDNLFLGSRPDARLVAEILDGLTINRFANSLAVRIGDPGVNFSAGQEQRLRIARGLFQGASLYLLDEPFNGIDNDTKAEIFKFLSEFLKHRTVVLVTHNAGELVLVDKVYELSGGVLRERGG